MPCACSCGAVRSRLCATAGSIQIIWTGTLRRAPSCLLCWRDRRNYSQTVRGTTERARPSIRPSQLRRARPSGHRGCHAFRRHPLCTSMPSNLLLRSGQIPAMRYCRTLSKSLGRARSVVPLAVCSAGGIAVTTRQTVRGTTERARPSIRPSQLDARQAIATVVVMLPPTLLWTSMPCACTCGAVIPAQTPCTRTLSKSLGRARSVVPLSVCRC